MDLTKMSSLKVKSELLNSFESILDNYQEIDDWKSRLIKILIPVILQVCTTDGYKSYVSNFKIGDELVSELLSLVQFQKKILTYIGNNPDDVPHKYDEMIDLVKGFGQNNPKYQKSIDNYILRYLPPAPRFKNRKDILTISKISQGIYYMINDIYDIISNKTGSPLKPGTRPELDFLLLALENLTDLDYMKKFCQAQLDNTDLPISNHHSTSIKEFEDFMKYYRIINNYRSSSELTEKFIDISTE